MGGGGAGARRNGGIRSDMSRNDGSVKGNSRLNLVRPDYEVNFEC